MTQTIDHDLLFKELLTTFFWDFLALFAPEILETAEQNSLTFLTQEVFNDLPGQTRRNVDIVAKLHFRGQETCFLVHVENQATSQADFAERMFLYFARLYEKYRLPIYPIALFSYRSPQRLEPETFSVAFPSKEILRFSFQTIQLNRLPWRDFLRQPNPVAAALMAKMNFSSEERPKVKLECLRMIVTLRLDSARIHLLSGFVDTYLRLNMAEQQVFEQELHRIQPQEETQVLRIVTSWMEEGLQQGRQEGRQEEACKLILRFVQQRFPEQVSGFAPQIQALNLTQLDALSDRLFGFESAAELETWLRENPTEGNPT
ncbi:DUF4351 domain-containing protein [Picosynechococcus sp. PCC 8807]|uniref:DUF4351 domain-containing protein n=1 Tax=Picosynechococcus sp. PCC 8807 TaxID=195248 RepID=UPI0008103572|nr:DUF4351 domain-containing protein [Picosynechococcus sp. PCC 8807]ANV89416.1 flagellar assembly protein H [Picosynechococcus sp. PCC 8807]